MARPPRFKHAVKQVRAEDLRLETWIQENFPDLNEAYPTGRLNLRELSQVIRAAGLTNTHGGRLSDAAISKTWSRVRKRMLTAPPLHVPKLGEIAPGVIIMPLGDTVPPRLPERTAPPGRSPVSVPPRSQTTLGHLSAAEQIARLRDEQRALRRPMPTSVDLGTPD